MIIPKERYWVVIPAAGSGKRLGAEMPKQYLKLGTKTVIEHTVSRFTQRVDVSKVLVVLHAADTQWSTFNMEHPEKIVTTVGGATRAESVMRGLEYLQSFASVNDWVIVHDVARPCLSRDTLDRFISTVQDHRVGGLLSIPVADTLKKVDADHSVRETISREQLWFAQTPQMFRYGLLFDAMRDAIKAGVVITDESSAIEWLGEHPLVVRGDPNNLKITEPDDFLMAEKLIQYKQD